MDINHVFALIFFLINNYEYIKVNVFLQYDLGNMDSYNPL